MATVEFSYYQDFNPDDLVNLGNTYSKQYTDSSIEVSVGVHGSWEYFEIRHLGPTVTHEYFENSDVGYFNDLGGFDAEVLTYTRYSAHFDFSDWTTKVSLFGGNWRDVLTAGAGNDVLSGGEGDDTLTGGAGNDTLMGGAGADVLDGGEGIDTVSYADAWTGVLASLDSGIPLSGDDAVGDTYIDVENLTGSDYNDFLIGDGSANVLIGGLGNDVLYAAPDDAVDRVNGGRGNDTLIGSTDDILIGGKGKDKIYIAGAAHSVRGGSGFDQLFINADGGVVFEAGDTITGIEKVFLTGSTANVDFSAVVSSGLDITAQAGNRTSILGTTGNDILRAGVEGDLLIAGAGNDTLIAGSSSDTIRIGAVHGRVEIRDYDIANDQLDFSESGAGSLSDLTITQFGSKTVINIAGESSAQRIVLTGTDHTDLIANGSLFFGMD